MFRKTGKQQSEAIDRPSKAMNRALRLPGNTLSKRAAAHICWHTSWKIRKYVTRLMTSRQPFAKGHVAFLPGGGGIAEFCTAHHSADLPAIDRDRPTQSG